MNARRRYREEAPSFSFATQWRAPVIPFICLVYIALHISLYLVESSYTCYMLPENVSSYESSDVPIVESLLTIVRIFARFLPSFEGCVLLVLCLCLALWALWLWMSGLSDKSCRDRHGCVLKLYAPYVGCVHIDVSFLPSFASPWKVFFLMLVMFVTVVIGIQQTSVVMQKSHELTLLPDDEVFKLEVISDARPHQNSYMYEASATYHTQGHVHTAHVDLQSKTCLSLGDCILARGKVKAYGMRERMRLRMGIAGRISARYIDEIPASTSISAFIIKPLHNIRKRLLSALLPNNLSADQRGGRALFAAGACGYKTELITSKLDKVCARVGIAHVVSISGAHVAMVCAAIESMTKGMNISQHKRKVFSLACCGVYTILCGASPASVRACLLFLVRVCASMFHRKSYAPSAVCFTGLCMLLYDAYLATRIGFMLSMVCVTGLALGADACTCYLEDAYTRMVLKLLKKEIISSKLPDVWYQGCVHALFSRCMQRVLASFAVSTCAYVCAFPICISVFREISLIGIFVNVLFVPMIMTYFQIGALMCIGVGVCTCVGIYPLIDFIFEGVVFAFDIWGAGIVRGLELLSQLPFASITCGAYISFCFSCVCFLVVGRMLYGMKRKIRF